MWRVEMADLVCFTVGSHGRCYFCDSQAPCSAGRKRSVVGTFDGTYRRTPSHAGRPGGNRALAQHSSATDNRLPDNGAALAAQDGVDDDPLMAPRTVAAAGGGCHRPAQAGRNHYRAVHPVHPSVRPYVVYSALIFT